MPPPVHPIWLLLIVCSILLLVGCNALINRTPTPTPTTYPPITLTVVTPLPLTDVFYTPQPTETPTKRQNEGGLPLDSPPPLVVLPPTCYELANGTLMCLGQVMNPSERPVGNAIIEVRLSNADTATTAAISTLLEQRQIPPGGLAPYRAIFRSWGNEQAHASATLASVRIISEPLVPLSIEDERGQQLDSTTGYGRYIITANIYNPTQRNASAVRAVATLLDDQEQVIGYRVVRLPGTLPAGTRQPLRIEIIPQAVGVQVRHTLHVEAGL